MYLFIYLKKIDFSIKTNHLKKIMNKESQNIIKKFPHHPISLGCGQNKTFQDVFLGFGIN